MTEQIRFDQFQKFDSRDETYSASFSPDGQLIAAGDAIGNVILWSPDGTRIKTLTGHDGPVPTVCFSPDGQILASCGHQDETIKLWQRDGTLIKTLNEHPIEMYQVYAVWVCFSPDGQILASGSQDGNIKLRQRDGTLIKTLVCELPSSDRYNPYYSLSFSPDGQTFISCDAEYTIKLWQRDGTFIKTLIENCKCNLMNLMNVMNGCALAGVTFSPDGELIAAGTMQGTVKLWNRDGTLVRTLGESRKARMSELTFSPDGRLRVGGLSFSPDGTTIAISFSQSDRLELWEVSGRLIKQLQIEGCDTAYSISFSPDGNTIAVSTSGAGTGIIKLRE